MVKKVGRVSETMTLPMRKRTAVVLETMIHGGARRERFLVRLLGNYYRSLFRRQWRWSERRPHFETQRAFMFDFAFSRSPRFTGASPFFRGFFGSEVVRDGDEVLDIGCGDGFFSMRFFSERASHVDAIDTDAEAICVAHAGDDPDCCVLD